MDEESELRALARELKRIWAAERAVERLMAGERADWADLAVELAGAAAGRVVERMAGLRASGLDGLRAKAAGVSWCHSGTPPDLGATTDAQLAAGIVQDLLDME